MKVWVILVLAGCLIAVGLGVMVEMRQRTENVVERQKVDVAEEVSANEPEYLRILKHGKMISDRPDSYVTVYRDSNVSIFAAVALGEEFRYDAMRLGGKFVFVVAKNGKYRVYTTSKWRSAADVPALGVQILANRCANCLGDGTEFIVIGLTGKAVYSTIGRSPAAAQFERWRKEWKKRKSDRR